MLTKHDILEEVRLKALLVVVLGVTVNLVHGQNTIQGCVLDKQTAEPLPFATIGAVHRFYGCYSDTSGLFTLNFLNDNDSLKISYLGYRSLYTTVQELQKNTKVLLEAYPVQMKEVSVIYKKKKKKEMEIGYFTTKSGLLLNPAFSMNLYATYIPFPKNGEDVMMKSIKFACKPAGKNSPLRVRVLKVMENGEPGEDMIWEDLIVNDYYWKGRYKVATLDIAKYDVYMPLNGVFIVLEWLEMDRTPVFSPGQASKNGPSVIVIPAGETYNTKWVTFYNHPGWKEGLSPFTIAIGLTVVNYIE